MALSDLFTNAQLEIACGGAATLLQLSGLSSQADAAYTAFIAEVREAADTDVYSLAQVTFNVDDPNVALVGLLRQKALAIAVYWAWSKGTGGQAIPEEVAKAHDRAIEALERLVEGGRALGSDTSLATSAGLAQVDPDPDGVRMTRENLGGAGFC